MATDNLQHCRGLLLKNGLVILDLQKCFNGCLNLVFTFSLINSPTVTENMPSSITSSGGLSSSFLFLVAGWGEAVTKQPHVSAEPTSTLTVNFISDHCKTFPSNFTPYVTEEVTRNWVRDNFLSSNHCTTMAHSCPCVTVNSPVPPPLWLRQGHCRMGEVELGGTCRLHGWWKDPLCWTAHPVGNERGDNFILRLNPWPFCTACISLPV